MMNQLVVWKPKIVIETWEGDVLFADGEKYEDFVKALETDRFVKIMGRGVNVKSIKNYYLDEQGVAGMDIEKLRILQSRKTRYERLFGCPPSKDTITAIIKAMEIGEMAPEEMPVKHKGTVVSRADLPNLFPDGKPAKKACED